jgi:hypothetical protein
MKSDLTEAPAAGAGLSRTLRSALVCCVPAAIFYAISLEIMTLSGFSAVESLRNLAQQTGQSSFLGFLSSMGAWFWVAVSALCLFGAALQNAAGGYSGGHAALLCGLGIFSLVLAVGDFFLIHHRYITEGILLPL